RRRNSLMMRSPGLIGGALLLTVVGSLSELLFALLSSEVATVAVLVTAGTAAAETPTVSVIMLEAVGINVPAFVQVTFCPTAEQLQPVPVPETKLKPVGNGSVTVMRPIVLHAPTLVTVSVYVPFVPTLKLPV